MCGRYAASTPASKLIEIFDAELDPRENADSTAGLDGLAQWTQPRWNIAPTDQVAAIIERERADQIARLLVGLRWGLVPSWSKDPHTAAKMINARAETVATKPAYRKAFAARRCPIPADGYYEWQTIAEPGGIKRARPRKQPYFISPKSGLMAMAGIYEFWRDPAAVDTDPWLVSCSIITTSASDDLGIIHDRMPVQIRPENWDAWLDPELTNPEQARALMWFPEPGAMHAHPVSSAVNSVRNDGAELVAALSESPSGNKSGRR